MNYLANIWKHPKTSAAGLLIAIMTVGGALSQQGITIGQHRRSIARRKRMQGQNPVRPPLAAARLVRAIVLASRPASALPFRVTPAPRQKNAGVCKLQIEEPAKELP